VALHISQATQGSKLAEPKFIISVFAPASSADFKAVSTKYDVLPSVLGLPTIPIILTN
jgi:hypothetical protein